jgi:hypothetical protein
VNTAQGVLADSYISWIRSSVKEEALNENTTELTTPFLDRHNDHVQIYAERQGRDLFLLTDDGYIIGELKAGGVARRGARRQELFNEILSGYGVILEKDELQVAADSSNLGRRAHNLIQAMLSLSDMFVLSEPQVKHIFLDDVTGFLDSSDIRYSPRVKFAGKSGLDHLVDFVIPKSRNAPERIVQAVNNPRRDRIESLLFAATDTRAARGKDVSFYALLNDSKREIPPDILNAFSTYEIYAHPWSRRAEIVKSLAA